MKSEEYGSVDYYYENVYSHVVGNQTLGTSRFLSAYPHLLLEAPFRDNIGKSVLEIGSGENEHFPFVAHNFSKYVAIDIKKPKSIPLDPRFQYIQGNVEKLPFKDSSFDRVIATCLLLHLDNPEIALEEIRRVVANNGFVSIYLPTEPSIILRLIRNIYSAKRAKALGFHGYKLFIARDHVTYFSRVLELIRFIFREDSVTYRYRPIPLRTWYLNAFCIIQIRINAEK
jgi:phosphatidylethanolamine/phosphatidyl-N-methylethanolamine N-methyltransferase